MTPESQIVFNQLEKALTRLEEMANLPPHEHRAEIDATIHRFEFTFELFWKFLKKKLYHEYDIEVHGPRSVLQQAYMHQIINNEDIWLAMLEDRNLTSHVYKEAVADQIYENIKEYLPFLKKELENCR